MCRKNSAVRCTAWLSSRAQQSTTQLTTHGCTRPRLASAKLCCDAQPPTSPFRQQPLPQPRIPPKPHPAPPSPCSQGAWRLTFNASHTFLHSPPHPSPPQPKPCSVHQTQIPHPEAARVSDTSHSKPDILHSPFRQGSHCGKTWMVPRLHSLHCTCTPHTCTR